MPWYVVAYVVVLAALIIYSFFDEVRSLPTWYVAIDLAVSAFWILAVFAYYDAKLAPPASVGVALFVAALVWTAWDVQQELKDIAKQRPESYDPDLSPGMNLWTDRSLEVAGIIVASMMLAPAVVLALRVLQRAK